MTFWLNPLIDDDFVAGNDAEDRPPPTQEYEEIMVESSDEDKAKGVESGKPYDQHAVRRRMRSKRSVNTTDHTAIVSDCVDKNASEIMSGGVFQHHEREKQRAQEQKQKKVRTGSGDSKFSETAAAAPGVRDGGGVLVSQEPPRGQAHTGKFSNLEAPRRLCACARFKFGG